MRKKEIIKHTGRVVDFEDGGHQAYCDCGYKGILRDLRFVAQEDLLNHYRDSNTLQEEVKEKHEHANRRNRNG